MKSFHSFIIVCLLFLGSLTSCGPSPKVMAAQTAEALAHQATAAAQTWTSTPSPVPSATPIPTLSPTPVGLINSNAIKNIRQLAQIGDGMVNVLLFSPDGRWLACASSENLSLYDATTWTLLWKAPVLASLREIAFLADGAGITGVDNLHNIYRWQRNDGKQLLGKQPEDVKEMPMAFTLSPDGQIVASAAYDDSLHLYSTNDASLTGKIENETTFGEMIYRMAFSPDSKRIVSISFNGDLRGWDVVGKKLAYTLPFDKKNRPYNLLHAPNGKLAIGYETKAGDKSTRIFDVYSRVSNQSTDLEVLAFTSQKELISLSQDGLKLYKPGSKEAFATLPELEEVQGVVASPDGLYLAAATAQGIHIWQLSDYAMAHEIPAEYTHYTALALSADGNIVAAGRLNGVELRKRGDGSFIKWLTTDKLPGEITRVAYSPQSDLVAGVAGKKLLVWMVETGQLVWELEADDPINELAFSADGSSIAAVYEQPMPPTPLRPVAGRITLWAAENGDQIVELEGKESPIFPGYADLTFSSDGAYLVAGSGSGEIEVWDTVSQSLLGTTESDSFLGWSPKVAISPNSKTFAAGGQDRQIVIRRSEDLQLVRKISVNEGTIQNVAYSGDGSIIAAGIYNTLHFWDIGKGNKLGTLDGSKDEIVEICFTSDQRYIVSLAKDGIIRIWGLP